MTFAGSIPVICVSWSSSERSQFSRKRFRLSCLGCVDLSWLGGADRFNHFNRRISF